MTYCVVNNNYIKQDTATLPISSRAVRFGDGIFETIYTHHGVPYLWHEHLQRLQDGLNALDIHYNCDGLLEATLQLVSKNAFETSIIRIMITRSGRSQGYLPLENEADVAIEEFPHTLPELNAIKLYHSTARQIPSACFPRHIKSNQAMFYALSQMEAREHHCDQALITTLEDYVSECSSATIFWTKNEELYTPNAQCDILPGTIAQVLQRISPYPVHSGQYTIGDLQQADEVFITNNGILLQTAHTIEPYGWKFSAKTPLATDLRQRLYKDIEAYAI